MNNKLTIILLLVLTVFTAVLSKYYEGFSYLVVVIMLLSAIKFTLVSFQFMELKKAHKAWKILVVGYLVIFVGIISLVIV